MYRIHPSTELVRLFEARPWQGAYPAQARWLFVGLDANYATDIERSSAFVHVLDYHADGVGFWRRHGVHHPFLLPVYRGDGRRYHRTFARIGFDAVDAPQVSFAELLHRPTVGRNRLEPSDLDDAHLAWLESAMFEGTAERVFVSDGVLRLMSRTRRFACLWRPSTAASGAALPVLYADNQRTVYLHLHFSNYGRFKARLDAEIDAIASMRHANRGDSV